tara:strand:+ start:192 stop:488 length:297 start_codon:yes stop_codon:yes gene_type:complete
MQKALNKISASSELHYNDFKKQVFEFSKQWRNHLIPMLFKQQKFTVKNYHELPDFVYKNRIESDIWINTLIIFSISGMILWSFSSKRLHNKSDQKLID